VLIIKPKVFVAKSVSKEVEDYLAQHCEYRIWPGERPITRAELAAAIADVDGLLLVGTKVDGELIAHAPKLKIVSNISVGYDNFDLDAMKARKVLGTNTPHVLDETVADLVFGLILGAARRISELDRLVKDGKWQKGAYEQLYGRDVHHTTLGIIGMGNIGEAIARRAKFGFAMNVLYHNRSRKPAAEEKFGAEYRSLNDLLKEADFVALMTPKTKETLHLMGAAQFDLMKPTAFFINASRGETVDEAALVAALKAGKIAGAGLDVFEREPVDPVNPLLALPNVVTLPHIGSSTARTRNAMTVVAAQNLVAGVTGHTPPNVVPELRDLVQ
jgi:Lactate dehydrogenase and related dehydrogenases